MPQFEQKYRNWRTDPEDLFSCQLEKAECCPEAKVVEQLANAGHGVDYLVLWLDCDRVGENICFEVINIVAPVMRPSFGRKVRNR